MKRKIFITILLAFPLLFTAQNAGNWSITGPIQFPTNVSGQIHGIGRVCQVKFHPTNAQKMYAVSASGGLYISNNNGQTWTVTGTDTQLPPTACASVCIDFTDDNILYLGTGDPNYYNQDYGVWKSTDGGVTWNQSTTGLGNRMAVVQLMDPNNHNTIVTVTDDGIWKTMNAGATWTVKKPGGAFKDMVLQPGSTTTLYAVNDSEFWRSTDFGETWTQITNGIAVPGGGNGGGMRIAVSAAGTNTVYVGMVKDEGTIFKSMDGGLTFTTVYHNAAQSLVGYDATGGGQGNYNFTMTADPTNANTVYVGAHVIWKSTDAGVTWTQMNDWWADLHTDIHQVFFNPYNATQLFCANDGGLWLNTNGAVATSWTTRSNGLDATEIYHAAQSPVRKDMISIGTQDNGELYYSGTTWKCNRGGDFTSKCFFPYYNDRTVHYDYSQRRDVIANGNDVAFNFPLSTTNASISAMAFNPGLSNLAFAAETDVYRSVNINGATPAWVKISSIAQAVKALHSSRADSNVVYMVTTNNKVHRSDNALAASPTFTSYATPSASNNRASITSVKGKANVVYMSCGSKVYRSVNKGANWTNITFNLPNINIVGIYHDPYSSNESIYIANTYGVYYKDSTMNGWINYTQGLPGICSIEDLMFYNDGTANSVLRVGTWGRGVWESPLLNSGAPLAAFSASQTSVCPGQLITFTDQSVGSPTAWHWTFQGGTPASSTQQNPTVTYNNTGTYAVTLSVTASGGSDTLVKTAYITVSGTNSLPVQEGFTAATFPPANWAIVDENNDGNKWTRSTTVGSQGSSDCMLFDNYNNNSSGSEDDIQTARYDFSFLTSAQLYFDVAYGFYDNTYTDTLEVLVSTDCGLNYTSVYSKGGTTLASTTGTFTTAVFVPTSTQWRSDTVNLNAFIGSPRVMVLFKNHGWYGQALYIDNINITAPNIGISEHDVAQQVQVYPNPNAGTFSLNLNMAEKKDYDLVLNDVLGRVLLQEKINSNNGTKTFNLKDKGVYFIHVIEGNTKLTKKIIVQ